MKSWVLNLEDGNLLSDQQELSKLSPKATQILCFLISRNDSVVSRSEILREVWHGRHANQDLVREYIFEIRKALGDNARAPKYVETVGRRGFRIVGPVFVQSKRKTQVVESEKGISHRTDGPKQLPLVKFCSSKDGVSIAHTASGKKAIHCCLLAAG